MHRYTPSSSLHGELLSFVSDSDDDIGLVPIVNTPPFSAGDGDSAGSSQRTSPSPATSPSASVRRKMSLEESIGRRRPRGYSRNAKVVPLPARINAAAKEARMAPEGRESSGSGASTPAAADKKSKSPASNVPELSPASLAAPPMTARATSFTHKSPKNVQQPVPKLATDRAAAKPTSMATATAAAAFKGKLAAQRQRPNFPTELQLNLRDQHFERSLQLGEEERVCQEMLRACSKLEKRDPVSAAPDASRIGGLVAEVFNLYNGPAQAMLQRPLGELSRLEAWASWRQVRDEMVAEMHPLATRAFEEYHSLQKPNDSQNVDAELGASEDCGTSKLYIDHGVLCHVWNNARGARSFATAWRRVWDALLRYRIVGIHAPFSALFNYKGTYVSATALPPLRLFDRRPELYPSQSFPDALLSRAAVDLMAALNIPQSECLGVPLARGVDGRFYLISIKEILMYRHKNSEVPIRTEALETFNTEIAVGARSEPRPGTIGDSLRGYLQEQVNACGVWLMGLVEGKCGTRESAESFLKEQFRLNSLHDKMHTMGLNMHQLYQLYESIGTQEVPGSPRMTPEQRRQKEQEGLEASHRAQQQGEHVATVFPTRERNTALFMINTEMVARVAKQFARNDLAQFLSEGYERKKTHLDVVNRVCKLLASRNAAFWENHLMPALRKKFKTPQDFVVGPSNFHLGTVVKHVAAALGLEFNAEIGAFDEFSEVASITPICILVPGYITDMTAARPSDVKELVVELWSAAQQIPDTHPRHQIAVSRALVAAVLVGGGESVLMSHINALAGSQDSRSPAEHEYLQLRFGDLVAELAIMSSSLNSELDRVLKQHTRRCLDILKQVCPHPSLTHVSVLDGAMMTLYCITVATANGIRKRVRNDAGNTNFDSSWGSASLGSTLALTSDLALEIVAQALKAFLRLSHTDILFSMPHLTCVTTVERSAENYTDDEIAEMLDVVIVLCEHVSQVHGDRARIRHLIKFTRTITGFHRVERHPGALTMLTNLCGDLRGLVRSAEDPRFIRMVLHLAIFSAETIRCDEGPMSTTVPNDLLLDGDRQRCARAYHGLCVQLRRLNEVESVARQSHKATTLATLTLDLVHTVCLSIDRAIRFRIAGGDAADQRIFRPDAWEALITAYDTLWGFLKEVGDPLFAALHLQAVGRGMAARWQVRILQLKKHAPAVQRLGRGFLVRKEMFRQLQPVLLARRVNRIRAAFCARLQMRRLQFERYDRHTQTIQRVGRGYFERSTIFSLKVDAFIAAIKEEERQKMMAEARKQAQAAQIRAQERMDERRRQIREEEAARREAEEKARKEREEEEEAIQREEDARYAKEQQELASARKASEAILKKKRSLLEAKAERELEEKRKKREAEARNDAANYEETYEKRTREAREHSERAVTLIVQEVKEVEKTLAERSNSASPARPPHRRSELLLRSTAFVPDPLEDQPEGFDDATIEHQQLEEELARSVTSTINSANISRTTSHARSAASWSRSPASQSIRESPATRTAPVVDMTLDLLDQTIAQVDSGSFTSPTSVFSPNGIRSQMNRNSHEYFFFEEKHARLLIVNEERRVWREQLLWRRFCAARLVGAMGSRRKSVMVQLTNTAAQLGRAAGEIEETGSESDYESLMAVKREEERLQNIMNRLRMHIAARRIQCAWRCNTGRFHLRHKSYERRYRLKQYLGQMAGSLESAATLHGVFFQGLDDQILSIADVVKREMAQAEEERRLEEADRARNRRLAAAREVLENGFLAAHDETVEEEEMNSTAMFSNISQKIEHLFTQERIRKEIEERLKAEESERELELVTQRREQRLKSLRSQDSSTHSPSGSPTGGNPDDLPANDPGQNNNNNGDLDLGEDDPQNPSNPSHQRTSRPASAQSATEPVACLAPTVLRVFELRAPNNEDEKGLIANEPFLSVLDTRDANREILRTDMAEDPSHPVWTDAKVSIPAGTASLRLLVCDRDATGIIEIGRFDLGTGHFPLNEDQTVKVVNKGETTARILLRLDDANRKATPPPEKPDTLLKLVRCSGLADEDPFSANDPYVVVLDDSGAELYRTAVLEDRTNPAWKDASVVIPAHSETATVVVFDHDTTGDEEIGRCMLDDAILSDLGLHHLQLSRDGGDPTGIIVVDCARSKADDSATSESKPEAQPEQPEEATKKQPDEEASPATEEQPSEEPKAESESQQPENTEEQAAKEKEEPKEEEQPTAEEPTQQEPAESKPAPSVTLTIQRCSGLAEEDPFSANDPFVVVQDAAGTELYRTAVLEDRTNPSWKDASVVLAAGTESVTVVVHDHDSTGDDEIGRAVLDCNSMGEHRLTVALPEPESEKRGVVVVTLAASASDSEGSS